MSSTKMWRQRLGLVLIAVAMAVTGSIMASTKAFAAAGITAESVQLGQATTITVSGCQPFNQDAVSIVITDSAGKEVESRFMTETTTLWRATEVGDYTVTVTCKRTDGSPDDTASATFKVTTIPITVAPASWKAGTQVTLSTSGYEPGEDVYVYLIGCPTGITCKLPVIYKEYGSVPADASGKFTFPAQVPTSLPAGEWRFQVDPIKSTIRRWSPAMTTTDQPTTIDVSPAKWGAGTKVTIWSSGFKPGETANLQVVATPNCKAGSTCTDFQKAVAAYTTTADYTGRIATSFSIPSDLAPGQYAIVATGTSSNIKRASTVIDTSGDVIQVTPANWKAGERVSLKASGFKPGETVTIEVWGLNPCPVDAGVSKCPPTGVWKKWTTKADSNGAINFTADVPVGLYGLSNFMASGQESSVARQSTQITIAPPVLEANPAVWKAGSKVTLHTVGLTPGEPVTLSIVGTKACKTGATCPQTTFKTWATTVAVGQNGEWTYQVQVPKDLPAGSWVFVATGKTSGAPRATATLIVGATLPPTGD